MTDRDRLKAALLAEAPEPPRNFQLRLAAEGVESREGHQWLALVATLLAIAIVGALLAAGHRLGSIAVTPTDRPGTSSSVAPTTRASYPVVSADDLAAAELTNAAGSVTPLNLLATSDGQTVELVAGYADSINTVLLFRGLPQSSSAPTVTIRVRVTEASGEVNGSTSSGTPPGSRIYVHRLNAGLHPRADGNAHATATVILYSPPSSQSSGGSPGPVPILGQWSFDFALNVVSSINLATPPSMVIGGWTYTVTVEATPNVIHVSALVQGASLSDLGPTGAGWHPLMLAGPNGVAPRQLDNSARPDVTPPKYPFPTTAPQDPKNTRLNSTWVRADAGKYQLTIVTPTEQRILEFTVP